MKHIQNVIYTAWLALFCLFYGTASGTNAEGNHNHIMILGNIIGVWLAGFILAMPAGIVLPESVGKLKHEQSEKLHSWKRFMVPLLNLLSLLVWTFGARFGVTEYGAIGFTILAGIFTGYVCGQQLWRVGDRIVSATIEPMMLRLRGKLYGVSFVGLDSKGLLQVDEELDAMRGIIRQTFIRLGLCYRRKVWRFSIVDRIERERMVITPDRIFYKLLLVKNGLNALPYGVFVSDIVSENTRQELAIALEREVNFHVSPESGLWLIVTRPGYEGSPESYRPYLDRKPTDQFEGFIFDDDLRGENLEMYSSGLEKQKATS